MVIARDSQYNEDSERLRMISHQLKTTVWKPEVLFGRI